MDKVVLIGAGNVATHLGKALKSFYHIAQVYSRTMESASALASKLGCEAVTDLSKVVTDADYYFCAVKDDVLPQLLPELCKGREKAIFVHTSGSLPMDVFKGYARRYGVFYPLQTFSKNRDVYFEDVPCFLEASDKETETDLWFFMFGITEKMTLMSSADRKYLHLSAVFACNFVNHCYDLAYKLLEQHGIPFINLIPLIDETTKKVLYDMSPREAQTGPAVRYDENIISMQSQMLEGRMKEIYDLMSKSIHERSMEQS